MKQLLATPPNYKEILAKFPDILGKPVVFTYGEVLYNPTNAEISFDLMAHEKVHEKQQSKFRGGVEAWWKEYLDNPAFRLEQEAEAYKRQFHFICSQDGRHTRGKRTRTEALHKFASDLSGKVYGNLCSYETAKKLISLYGSSY